MDAKGNYFDTWIVLLDKWLDRMCCFKQLYSSRFAAKVQRSVAMDCGPVDQKEDASIFAHTRSESDGVSRWPDRVLIQKIACCIGICNDAGPCWTYFAPASCGHFNFSRARVGSSARTRDSPATSRPTTSSPHAPTLPHAHTTYNLLLHSIPGIPPFEQYFAYFLLL